MMIRLLLTSLWRRPRQLMLILVAVAVTAATVTALASFTTRARSGLAQDLSLFGPNLIIRPEVGGPRHLPAGIAHELRDLPGVVAVAAVARTTTRARLIVGPDGTSVAPDPQAEPMPLIAADEHWTRLHPAWQWHGHWPRPGEVALGAGIALPVATDATVPANVHAVSGTLTTGEQGQDLALLVPLSDLAAWHDGAGVGRLEARVKPDRLQAVADAAQARIPGIDAEPVRRVSQSDAQLTRRVALLLAAVAVVTLLLAALSVATSTTALIGERRRELALFIALGYTGERVGVLVGAELFIAALVAALAGGFAGEAAAGSLSRHILGLATLSGVTWQGLTAAVLAALLVVGLSSVLAFLRIRGLDLAFLLRGD
jgi:putative ABC transport system permease protein